MKNSYDFVLDCSVVMAWCFDDERSEYSDSILTNFNKTSAIVPSLLPMEVANVLLLY